MRILPYSLDMVAGIAPILIALLSFILRITDLGRVKGFIFDEVYYVDGARDLLKYGVEVTGANSARKLEGILNFGNGHFRLSTHEVLKHLMAQVIFVYTQLVTCSTMPRRQMLNTCMMTLVIATFKQRPM